jgi:hypothetical protein
VSLNDGKLYGVDLRLRNKAQGQLAVSLLPYGAARHASSARSVAPADARAALQSVATRSPTPARPRRRCKPSWVRMQRRTHSVSTRV